MKFNIIKELLADIEYVENKKEKKPVKETTYFLGKRCREHDEVNCQECKQCEKGRVDE